MISIKSIDRGRLPSTRGLAGRLMADPDQVLTLPLELPRGAVRGPATRNGRVFYWIGDHALSELFSIRAPVRERQLLYLPAGKVEVISCHHLAVAVDGCLFETVFRYADGATSTPWPVKKCLRTGKPRTFKTRRFARLQLKVSQVKPIRDESGRWHWHVSYTVHHFAESGCTTQPA